MALCEEVYSELPLPEVSPGRRPRRDAAERRVLCVRNIMAHLAALAFGRGRYDGLIVPIGKSKRDRYTQAPFSSDAFLSCLRSLVGIGAIVLLPGVQMKTRTRLELTDVMRLRLERCGATMRDVVRVRGRGETIQLRALGDAETEAGEWINYADDHQSCAMRADMEALNDWLNAADIRHDGSLMPPTHLVRIFHQRSLAAAPSWSLHGRLYWGFWINMKRAERRGITIDGEAVVDLDFQACFLRLAYAHKGLRLPEGDPYAIPGLESNRAEVKRLISSLFFRKPGRPAKRFPDGFAQKMPERWTMGQFVQAVASKHPAIAGVLNTEVGWELFATESRIMVAILLRLMREGVVALGCHDGLLVKAVDKEQAERAMREVSLEVLGQVLPVVLKPFREASN